PSSLHTEHDGEQLHHVADAYWIFISVRVAAHGQPARTLHRLMRAGVEPAYAAHHRAGPHRRRSLYPACALVRRSRVRRGRVRRGAVRSSTRPRLVAASHRLLQSCRTGLHILFHGRSCLPVLSLRIVYQYIRNVFRPGISPSRSFAAGELSLEHALSCWRSRAAIPAGEIYFSLRSSSGAGNFPLGILVEAPDS